MISQPPGANEASSRPGKSPNGNRNKIVNLKLVEIRKTTLFAGLLLLAALLSAQAEGQSTKQPIRSAGSRQQPAEPIGKQTGQQSAQNEQNGAPFFSIKDGKTSARRIKQLAHLAKPPAASGGRQRLAANELMQEDKPLPIGKSGQQNLQPSDMAGQSGESESSPANGQLQQQMAISSFNQLVGAGALEDFFNGGPSSTARPAEMEQEQITTTSGPGSALADAMQQFTTATGSPVSTPSSLSMSLDGMILNSRPRASSKDANSRTSNESFAKTNANNKRIGDGEPAAENRKSLEVREPAKASRRVPFSGVPFSSPASKGQRTKPANQRPSMEQLAEQAPTERPSTSTTTTTTTVTPASAASGSGFNGGNTFGSGRQNPISAGQMQQLEQGFEEDSRPAAAGNSDQMLEANAGLEMMKNLLAMRQAREMLQQQQVGQQANADEMVMSVMSSPDGKERRLVMIPRSTLESLQRFAAQRQQQSTSGTKSNWFNSAGGQRAASRQTSGANWMGSKSLPADSWQTNSANQNPAMQQQQTRLGNQMSAFAGQQQPEAQQQTTTQLPQIFTSPFMLMPTTTTTQLPSSSTFESGSTGMQGPEMGLTIADMPAFGTANATATTTTTMMPAAFSQQSTAADSFREVPVSTLAEGSQGNLLLSSGGDAPPTAQRPKQTSSASSSSSSSSAAGVKTASRQSANKKQPNNRPASGTKKRPNSSAKKNNVGGKQAAGQQQKPSANKAADRKSATSVGAAGKKQAGSGMPMQTTNGQQRMSMERVLEQAQQQRQSMAAGGKQRQVAVARAPVEESRGAGQSGSTRMEALEQQRQANEGDFGNAGTTVAPFAKSGQFSEQQSSFAPDRPNGNGNAMAAGSESDANAFDRQMDEMERQKVNGGADEQSNSNSDNLDREGGSSTGTGGLEGLRNAIPGEPIQDYPIYSSPPRTSFSCNSQSCPAGYYADVESRCQAFHICHQDGRSDSFLCPNGTIFSQEHFVCVFWWQFDCSSSAKFFQQNDNIYCNTPLPANAAGSPQQQSFSSNRNQANDGTSNATNNSNADAGSSESSDDSQSSSSPDSSSSGSSPTTAAPTGSASPASTSGEQTNNDSMPGFVSSTSSSLMRPMSANGESEPEEQTGSQQQQQQRLEITSSKRRA